MSFDDIKIDFGSMDEGEETTRRAAFSIDTTPITDTSAITSVNPPVTKVAPFAQHRPGVWKLLPDMIPTLPEYYVLEKSAVFVPNAASNPSEVSMRISAELRDRSIEARYDEDVAKAKCVTPEGVDFRIKMYRGRGKFSHGIIVEVQRRFGMSTHFHVDTMAILERAQGVEVSKTAKNSLPLVSDGDDEYKPNGRSSLAMIEKMLNAGDDSLYLAFQSLTFLTDKQAMGPETSIAISKELLQTDNHVGNKVLSYVLDTKTQDELYDLRCLAVTVLANALNALRGNVDPGLREQLLPVLTMELRNSEKNQRIALQAARCVEMFLSSDDQASGDLEEALKIARHVGNSRHSGLEKQALACLDMITSSK